MKILVTGGAGFVGSHACETLLAQGAKVVAIDNFDPYYSPARKRRNIAAALANPAFKLVEGDYGNKELISNLLKTEKFDAILHLAAQAGVRPSLEDPQKYQRVNVGSLITLLEAMRAYGPTKIVAASSSSVYGNVTPVPFREDAACQQPQSPYGASKRASEIFLGTYSVLYGIDAIVVRPFTVYGPRQRPDMAIAMFARKILKGEPITLFGDGTSGRDYTYVSDIVAGCLSALQKFPVKFGIYNLGGDAPILLNDLVAALEKVTGKKAIVNRTGMQQGDVERTAADLTRARRDLGFNPQVNLLEGLKRTVAWVKEDMACEGE